MYKNVVHYKKKYPSTPSPYPTQGFDKGVKYIATCLTGYYVRFDNILPFLKPSKLQTWCAHAMTLVYILVKRKVF